MCEGKGGLESRLEWNVGESRLQQDLCPCWQVTPLVWLFYDIWFDRCVHHPNTKRFKKTFIYFSTDTQCAHFQGNPLYQATKRHLTNKRSKTMKNESKRLILFWFSFYTLFGAWKIVGMTILVCASFFWIEEDWREDAGGRGQRPWSIWPARNWNNASTGVMPLASSVHV